MTVKELRDISSILYSEMHGERESNLLERLLNYVTFLKITVEMECGHGSSITTPEQDVLFLSNNSIDDLEE